MNLPLSIKFGDLFFIVLSVSVFYSILYWKIFDLRFHDAIYKSVSIQTLSGNTINPSTPNEKIVMVTQFLTAYLLMTGLIIVNVKH